MLRYVAWIVALMPIFLNAIDTSITRVETDTFGGLVDSLRALQQDIVNNADIIPEPQASFDYIEERIKEADLEQNNGYRVPSDDLIAAAQRIFNELLRFDPNSHDDPAEITLGDPTDTTGNPLWNDPLANYDFGQLMHAIRSWRPDENTLNPFNQPSNFPPGLDEFFREYVPTQNAPVDLEAEMESLMQAYPNISPDTSKQDQVPQYGDYMRDTPSWPTPKNNDWSSSTDPQFDITFGEPANNVDTTFADQGQGWPNQRDLGWLNQPDPGWGNSPDGNGIMGGQEMQLSPPLTYNQDAMLISPPRTDPGMFDDTMGIFQPSQQQNLDDTAMLLSPPVGPLGQQVIEEEKVDTVAAGTSIGNVLDQYGGGVNGWNNMPPTRERANGRRPRYGEDQGQQGSGNVGPQGQSRVWRKVRSKEAQQQQTGGLPGVNTINSKRRGDFGA